MPKREKQIDDKTALALNFHPVVNQVLKILEKGRRRINNSSVEVC